MKTVFASLGRVAVTLAVVAVAALGGWQLWVHYMDEPWTRDGHVQADVVGVAPDVSGLVTQVLVHDNQPVRKGDLILRIDRPRFELALRQAEAVVNSREAALQEATLEMNRYKSLNSLSVSQEKQQQTLSMAMQANAAWQQALADRDLAKLNLDRTDVTAPVNGIITNFSLRPGDYLTAGHAVTALVDTDTLHVDAYFEETKLHRIHIGDPVTIRMLGGGRVLRGRVDSIAGGIEDRERTDGSNLLANVNPTFSWVRLAQRFPVRITVDPTAGGERLIPGQTATVEVLPKGT
jgi:RND family efflux transporter MFP subunit